MLTKEIKRLTFYNNASLRSCISKINNTIINNTKDLRDLILTYNLLEYSDNYCITSGSLWKYYRDQVYDEANEHIPVDNYGIKNNKATTSKSFKYRTKIIGSTPADGNICRRCCSVKIFE